MDNSGSMGQTVEIKNSKLLERVKETNKKQKEKQLQELQ